MANSKRCGVYPQRWRTVYMGCLAPNGAGKTTLINILIGILPSSGGTIRLDGNDTAKMGRGYFDLIGYMPQYPQFYANFTVLEFLSYMCQLKGGKGRQQPYRRIPRFCKSL